jgi:membrane-bound metal-dependent hydrolase YbcI (DUF457 family)
MFLGHFAVGLAAKKVAPRVSLGTLFLASQFVDLVWPLFLLLGLEHVTIDPGNTAATPLDFTHYPYTHSLLGALLWSVLLGFLYFRFGRAKQSALIVALCVFSHWVLDFITHRPDLPLTFWDDARVGLGLWNSLPATVALEAGILGLGVSFYTLATKAMDRVGSIGFWALISTLIVTYIVNILGPPPPDESMIAIAGNAMWLFVTWAYWVDRHRTSVTPPAGA